MSLKRVKNMENRAGIQVSYYTNIEIKVFNKDIIRTNWKIRNGSTMRFQMLIRTNNKDIIRTNRIISLKKMKNRKKQRENGYIFTQK